MAGRLCLPGLGSSLSASQPHLVPFIDPRPANRRPCGTVPWRAWMDGCLLRHGFCAFPPVVFPWDRPDPFFKGRCGGGCHLYWVLVCLVAGLEYLGLVRQGSVGMYVACRLATVRCARDGLAWSGLGGLEADGWMDGCGTAVFPVPFSLRGAEFCFWGGCFYFIFLPLLRGLELSSLPLRLAIVSLALTLSYRA